MEGNLEFIPKEVRIRMSNPYAKRHPIQALIPPENENLIIDSNELLSFGGKTDAQICINSNGRYILILISRPTAFRIKPSIRIKRMCVGSKSVFASRIPDDIKGHPHIRLAR